MTDWKPETPGCSQHNWGSGQVHEEDTADVAWVEELQPGEDPCPGHPTPRRTTSRSFLGREAGLPQRNLAVHPAILAWPVDALIRHTNTSWSDYPLAGHSDRQIRHHLPERCNIDYVHSAWIVLTRRR